MPAAQFNRAESTLINSNSIKGGPNVGCACEKKDARAVGKEERRQRRMKGRIKGRNEGRKDGRSEFRVAGMKDGNQEGREDEGRKHMGMKKGNKER